MEKINYKNQGSRVKGGKLSSYSGSPPILGGDEGVVIRRSTPPSPLSTSTPLNPLFNKEGKPIGRGVHKEGVPFDAVRPELVEGVNGSLDRPKAGVFDKEGKPQGSGIVKRFLLSLAAVLCLTAAPAHALDISDYTAYPPFLPRVTSPNILFLLDYSKSMVRPAYGNCKSVSDYSDAGVRDADVDDDGSTTGEPTSDVAAQNISDCRTTFNQIGVGEITLTGTVAVTNGSATVTGTGTQFSTALSAGNIIRIKNVDYTVKSISSDTDLTLGIPSGADSTYRGTTESGLTVYKVGTLIGTVAVTNGSATVTGTGTTFSTELAAGGTIVIKDVPYTISSIASDTSLTLASSYTGTTASGFTARKGDSYSKITPYSGYFDNGYSGSGSYLDASSYKYCCTAASNGTCQKTTATTCATGDGPWNGNWLNWLTATQFDILKKVAIGGDVNPAPEQSSPGKVRSILTDGYTFRKTMTLKDGDTSPADGILDYCAGKIPDSLCKMWPTVTYSWLSCSGSCSETTVFGGTDANGVVSSTTLPFPFTFYSKTYSTIYINENGWFSFTSNSTAPTAQNIPDPNAPNNIIAPYWTNLQVCDSSTGGSCTVAVGGSIKTFTTGTAPNRIFVITFDKMAHEKDNTKINSLTFQVLLYEGSNHIVFQYKEVQPSQPFGAAKTVETVTTTIGVENSDGTGAKKYSYNGTLYDGSTSTGTALANCKAANTDAQHTGCAIFMTPHLSFTVTPRSGTTDFQPAAPFDFGGSTGGYKIEIEINENASCTSEGVGCYYNKDRNKYYDHQTVGLLQDFRDGELGGTLGFRLGIMQLNATDGGSVVKHFNAKDTTGWSSLMNATRSQTPLTNTPLAEALYEATGYFSETESWDYGSDWTYHSTSSTCASTGTNYDPYCSQSAAQRVPCCKSFVLLVSSGNYSNDNRTNIYGDADDANGTINTGALKAIDGGSLTSGTTGEGTKLNGGYLDNVAYKAHTTDWRENCVSTNNPVGCLEENQNLTLYAINTFGEGSGDGTAILKKAAKYGGFEDTDDDSAYDADKYNLVSGTCTGVSSGGAYGEDDKNCNGVPDTYFEASGGSDLKSKIIDAVTEIMKSSASGTSVSVLSTSAGGEGAIYQAYFYPAKVEGTTDERTWPGFMKSFFLDKKQNLRDDSSGGTYTCSGDSCTYSGTPNAALSATGDKIAQMCLNTTTNEVKVKLYADAGGDYVQDTANDGTCPSVTSSGDPKVVSMDDVVSIWEAGKKLALRDKSTRNIYTWVPTTVTATNNEGFSSLSGTPMDFTDDNKTLLSPYLRASDPDGANPRTADGEAQNIINFIRGNHIDSLAGTVSGVDYRYTYRNRCVTISGATTETNCSGSNQRVWALGDIINSTPTLVSGPGEQYDLLYGDANYTKFRAKYQNRRRMVYVGANDGMLHAFNAGLFNESTTSFSANPASPAVNGWGLSELDPELGAELWAFVPYDNLPHLQWLACNGTESDPSQCGSSEYTHVYYVDSRPKVTDVRIFNDSETSVTGLIDGQSGASHPGGWGTIMIMSMRLGGGAIDVTIGTNREFRSAYYAFDVTDPEKPPKLLWRFYDSTLGFTTSYPAIVRICSAGDNPCTGTIKWYMVVGSGPNNKIGTQASGIRDYGGNSTDMAGKVFVIDLINGSIAKSFTFASNEYMGDPLVVDENFDFTADAIYIGSSIGAGSTTVTGKVYRIKTNGKIPPNSSDNECDSADFPASPGTPTDWCRSVLIDAGKPVLTAPSVAIDSQRNLWVFFGTGRLRNSGDPSDLTNSEQQTFYGIKDACGEKGSTCFNAYDITTSGQFANVSNSQVTLSDQKVSDVTGVTLANNDYSTLLSTMRNDSVKGWYYHLNKPATASERVLSRAAILGGVVLFTTYTPAASICSIFGDSRLYALNYETGTAYNKAIIGTSDTGVSTTTSSTGTKVSKALELGKGMPTAVGIAVGEKVTGFVQKSTGEIIRIEAEPGTSVKSGAASWREKTGGGTSEIETIYKHIVK